MRVEHVGQSSDSGSSGSHGFKRITNEGLIMVAKSVTRVLSRERREARVNKKVLRSAKKFQGRLPSQQNDFAAVSVAYIWCCRLAPLESIALNYTQF